jgi:hypothetical protein
VEDDHQRSEGSMRKKSPRAVKVWSGPRPAPLAANTLSHRAAMLAPTARRALGPAVASFVGAPARACALGACISQRFESRRTLRTSTPSSAANGPLGASAVSSAPAGKFRPASIQHDALDRLMHPVPPPSMNYFGNMINSHHKNRSRDMVLADGTQSQVSHYVPELQAPPKTPDQLWEERSQLLQLDNKARDAYHGACRASLCTRREAHAHMCARPKHPRFRRRGGGRVQAAAGRPPPEQRHVRAPAQRAARAQGRQATPPEQSTLA